MRFCFIAQDVTFSGAPGFINGGTVTFWHLVHTLESFGHRPFLHELGIPLPEADVYIIQSEWYEKHKDELKEKQLQGRKVVVWLGHFKGGVYFDPTKIEADVFYTTWTGPVVDEWEEKTGKKLHFLPHAYCTFCDSGEVNTSPKILWIGNTYALREESWLKGIDVVGMKNIHPGRISDLYRGALVCPNIHGDFQKGGVSNDPSSIADTPGMALNERTFQILGSGGFMVCDYHPHLYDFFDENDIITGINKEEFQQHVRYFVSNHKKRLPYIRKLMEKIRNGHTYEDRLRTLLGFL